MRADEFITEAKGLFGRKIGDKFANDNGIEAQFQGIEVFPSQKPNSGYKTLEKAQQAAEQIEASLKGDIEWVNSPTQAARSFAIATLTGANNKTYYLHLLFLLSLYYQNRFYILFFEYHLYRYCPIGY